MNYLLLRRSWPLPTAHYQKRNGIDKTHAALLKYVISKTVNYINTNSGLQMLNKCVHKQPERKGKGGT